jgi:hypothetical protein
MGWLSRDAAKALALAATNKAIIGRYCLSNPPMSLRDILAYVTEHFPQVKVPRNHVSSFFVFFALVHSVQINSNLSILKAPTFVAKIAASYAKNGMGEFLLYHIGQVPVISCNKATRAGITLSYSVQTTIQDTVQYFLEHHHLDERFGTPMKESCLLC